MKKIKKLCIVLIAVVMCVTVGVSVWAAENQAVTFKATIADDSICVSDVQRQVTVTIAASKEIDIASFDATVLVPEGWTTPSLSSDFLTAADYEGCDIMWFSSDVTNVTTTNLVKITYTIPAEATGTFELGLKNVELAKLTDDFDLEYLAQELTVSTTLTINEHSDILTDGDHACDECYKENITNHVYGEVSYDWAEDGKSCTASRTCNCSDEQTAIAKITDEVAKKATCTEVGDTKYTATFNEIWATTQTTTVEGDIPATDHNWSVSYDWTQVEGEWQCKATRTCANSTDCTLTETVTASSAVKTPASCTVNGWTTYTADFTAEWAETQTQEEQDIPATNHDWSVSYDWTQVEGEWKCTATRTCANSTDCTLTETVTASSAEKTPASCEVNGWTTYTADFTAEWAVDQTLDKQDIPQKGHSYTGELKNDGDTHSYKCVNDGCNEYGNSEGHTYDQEDGTKCACGAVKPITLKGDVNLDGNVTIDDLTYLAKHIAKIETITAEQSLINAEVNDDGEVTIDDLTKLARYIAKIIPNLD